MTIKPRFNWRHQYDDDRDKKEGELAALECKDPSLTQQSFVQDANLNVIAKRYGITDIPNVPISGDVIDTSLFPSLTEILDHQREAIQAWQRLPLKIRKRFHEDPNELLDFLADPDNRQEAIRLGLLTPTPGAASASSTTASASATPAPAHNATGDQPPRQTEGEPKKAPQTP